MAVEFDSQIHTNLLPSIISSSSSLGVRFEIRVRYPVTFLSLFIFYIASNPNHLTLSPNKRLDIWRERGSCWRKLILSGSEL